MRKLSWPVLVLLIAAAIIVAQWVGGGETSTQRQSAAADRAAKAASAPAVAPKADVATNPGAGGGAQGRAPEAARSQSATGSTSTTPVRLTFQVPASVKVGEAFDLIVDVDANPLIASITLGLKYDPALLRVRTSEEIDYSNELRPRGRFSVAPGDDGNVSVELQTRNSAQPIAGFVSLAVAQFEALAPGQAQVAISNINASGPNGAAVPVTTPTRIAQIAVY